MNFPLLPIEDLFNFLATFTLLKIRNGYPYLSKQE
jgi:hypothetical protein